MSLLTNIGKALKSGAKKPFNTFKLGRTDFFENGNPPPVGGNNVDVLSEKMRKVAEKACNIEDFNTEFIQEKAALNTLIRELDARSKQIQKNTLQTKTELREYISFLELNNKVLEKKGDLVAIQLKYFLHYAARVK